MLLPAASDGEGGEGHGSEGEGEGDPSEEEGEEELPEPLCVLPGGAVSAPVWLLLTALTTSGRVLIPDYVR